jgi:NAD(P)-dependent dehydrogenase (short-subunit alcohol dehydrogenase family)
MEISFDSSGNICPGEIMTAANPFALGGRDVWVFGGAGYLGQSVVSLLVPMSARVLCVDLANRAEEFVGKAGLQDQVTAASLDVGDTQAVAAFVEEQCAQRGIPHGIVLMTYASTSKRMQDLTVDDFDRVNHGNLTATFALARDVGQRMAERGGGSIVMFSSMYGSVSTDPSIYEAPMNPNPIEYGVGKAGLQQMARYFAVHFGKCGVRCNAVSPGPFPNPNLQRDQPAFMDRLASKVPLGRIGQAREIAGTVVYLLSDASSFVTGQNLAVDGGWTAW